MRKCPCSAVRRGGWELLSVLQQDVDVSGVLKRNAYMLIEHTGRLCGSQHAVAHQFPTQNAVFVSVNMFYYVWCVPYISRKHLYQYFVLLCANIWLIMLHRSVFADNLWALGDQIVRSPLQVSSAELVLHEWLYVQHAAGDIERSGQSLHTGSCAVMLCYAYHCGQRLS